MIEHILFDEPSAPKRPEASRPPSATGTFVSRLLEILTLPAMLALDFVSLLLGAFVAIGSLTLLVAAFIIAEYRVELVPSLLFLGLYLASVAWRRGYLKRALVWKHEVIYLCYGGALTIFIAGFFEKLLPADAVRVFGEIQQAGMGIMTFVVQKSLAGYILFAVPLLVLWILTLLYLRMVGTQSPSVPPARAVGVAALLTVMVFVIVAGIDLVMPDIQLLPGAFTAIESRIDSLVSYFFVLPLAYYGSILFPGKHRTGF